MRNLRWTIPTLALAALLAAGCILVSGQFIVSYDLPTPLTSTQAYLGGVAVVDLNTVGTYTDHKSDLKGLSDVAILGEFTNTGSTPVDVELWMTPDLTRYSTPDVIITDASAVKVWGPLRLAVGETKKIGWDQSAGLFKQGKAALTAQIKGDGVFSLYAVAPSLSYSFRINHGVLVAVVQAAK
jgi:hypothetical protein